MATRCSPGRVTQLLALIAVVTSTGAVPASADERGLRNEDCSAVQIAVRVPPQQVTPALPTGFEADTNELGDALVTLTMERCRRTVIDGTALWSTVVFHADIPIKRPPQFAGPSPVPPDPFDFHSFGLGWSATNSLDLARYLREQGANGDTIKYVADLSYDVADDGASTFVAPRPAPAPFTATARLLPVTVSGPDITTAGYGLGRGGVLISTATTEGLQFSAPAEWEVAPVAGTPIDVLLCEDQRSSAAAGSDDESLNAEFDTASVITRLHETTDIETPGDPACLAGT